MLGDINSFHAHSYVTYEEEEKKRLHEQWLVLPGPISSQLLSEKLKFPNLTLAQTGCKLQGRISLQLLGYTREGSCIESNAGNFWNRNLQ